MALSKQAQNMVSNIRQDSEVLIAAYYTAKQRIIAWDENNMYVVLDDQLGFNELSELAHLTRDEVSNIVSTMTAFVGLMEANNNTHLVNLIKQRG